MQKDRKEMFLGEFWLEMQDLIMESLIERVVEVESVIGLPDCTAGLLATAQSREPFLDHSDLLLNCLFLHQDPL